MTGAIATRRFSWEDQRRFARLSGDANPIHVDPLAARRSIFGEPVVHGIHLLLWSLGCLAGRGLARGGVSRLDVRFPGPTFLGDEVTLRLQTASPTEMKLKASVRSRPVAVIGLRVAERLPGQAPGEEGEGERGLVPAGLPEDRGFSTLSGSKGSVGFAATGQEFASAFPDAAALVGSRALRGIGACSRLVGMDCPGMRSVFSRLVATLHGEEGAGPYLAYEVEEADERFGLVRIRVAGAGLNGHVEAFSPAAPPEQPRIDEVARLVGPHEFAGRTALVVGGSRGLGELVAKAVAAGGGRVVVTYASGRADAERVASEIRAFGAQADVLAYDVTRPAEEQMEQVVRFTPTQAYYFATCRIGRPRVDPFEPDRLALFLRYYVHGFHELCLASWRRGLGPMAVAFPSSVFVEERPPEFLEYAMAKAAGEVLGAEIPRLMPGIRVVARRLPRLLTDQTAGITAEDLPPAIDEILRMVRKM